MTTPPRHPVFGIPKMPALVKALLGVVQIVEMELNNGLGFAFATPEEPTELEKAEAKNTGL